MTKQSLLDHVIRHIKQGSEKADYRLGAMQMPEGYALMLNKNKSHFYWLRHDGAESVIFCNLWMTYKAAASDKRLVDLAQ